MGQGQTYDPRKEPALPQAGGWVLLTVPKVDRVHEWTRPWGDFDVIVRRIGGEWWEFEILYLSTQLVHEGQASSAAALVMKIRLWIFFRTEREVAS